MWAMSSQTAIYYYTSCYYQNAGLFTKPTAKTYLDFIATFTRT